MTTTSHPCFGPSARASVARVHLPVAPRTFCRTNFAPMTKQPAAIMPEDALSMLDGLIESGKKIKVVGITGPGDPLANFEATYKTLKLVHDKYPRMSLCLTTLGINGAEYAAKLAELKISHITVLVDAADSATAEKIYAWIRPSTKNIPLPEAAKLLMNEQAAAIKAFKEAGLTVKVNTTIYNENIDQIENIAIAVKMLNADIMGLTPFIPNEDSEFSAVSDEQIAEARTLAAKHIELMEPWLRCGSSIELEKPVSSNLPKPSKSRPNVAVASSSGMDIDLHLGHAHKLMIFGPREDGLACLLETREAPEPGGGKSRWEKLAEMLNDCFVLLCSAAGETPKKVLAAKGIRTIQTDENVEGTVDVLYGGGKKGKCKK
ncbi:NifB/NifX family molybdenum-iron cluster-binding protein [Desulfovibrio sp. JC022]|uniref:NifB/NifX family molybdenum-iron cluster-binding protein n=1 Tax=Desulfovibrio sp. JC022 TaxID=2593642 RepID=UPI0013D58062|nr:NifB/NifX family molybdenum-iron cluster-binding protein [Desulfovibrio sp. JC022]NDV23371.1 radical SAM protein [Desulfovibrio sp. JC022]